MDPITFTFPGFRNLFQGKFSNSNNVPLSNDYVIVFPMNPSDKKFSRTIYSPEMTNGRASTEELNQALTFFELAMSRAVTPSDLKKSFWQRFLFPFLLIWIFCTFFRPRCFEPFWFCFVVYCIVGIYNLFKNRNAQNKRAKADSQGVLDFIQPGYLQKGLRWRIPEESYEWIELIKEYREGEKPSATAVQIYPTLPEHAKVNSQYAPPQTFVTNQ